MYTDNRYIKGKINVSHNITSLKKLIEIRIVVILTLSFFSLYLLSVNYEAADVEKY